MTTNRILARSPLALLLAWTGVVMSGCADAPTAPLSAPVGEAALQADEVPIQITGIVVANGSVYVAASGGMQDSARVYLDRAYTYSNVPAALLGQTYIRTRQANAAVTGNPQFLSFSIDREAEIYLAYHGTTPPDWATASGFTAVGETLTVAKNVDLETLHLFSRVYPAGTVTLGSNDGAVQMYTVVARATAPSSSTAAARPIREGISR